MIPLSKPFVPIKAEKAINECLKSGWLGYGPVCNSLEDRFISKHGGWALATTSCTSALHIAAQLIRVSEADEVIIPAMTFISTAMAFHAAGFKVRLADVDPATLLLSKSTVEKLTSDKTRAVVAVHLYGQKAPVEEIRELCDRYNLIMIEDCAHRLSLLDDIPLLADFACYSFNAVKEAPCGEGGLLWARSLELEKHARELSNLGLNIDTFQRASNLNHSEIFFGKEIGLKLRLNDILASMVNTSIDTLSETRIRRSAVFDHYDSKIAPMAPYVIPFKRRDDDSFLMYVVRLENLNRERLREDMARMGIATSVHYTSLSEHSFFNLADCPVSYINSMKLLSLPCFPDIEKKDQDKVVCGLVKALENQKKE